MFEQIFIVVMALLPLVALVGWISAHIWKSRYHDAVDECECCERERSHCRTDEERLAELDAIADQRVAIEMELREQERQAGIVSARRWVPRPSTATVVSSNQSDGFVESAAIAAATDNAMLGALVGGNLLGGVVGEMLHDSTERQVVEAAEPLVVEGETIVEAADRLELDGDGARVLDTPSDATEPYEASSSLDSDSSSYDSGSSYDSSSSYDSGSSYDSSSDSGFSSSDW